MKKKSPGGEPGFHPFTSRFRAWEYWMAQLNSDDAKGE